MEALMRAAEILAILDQYPEDTVNSPEIQALEEELDGLAMYVFCRSKSAQKNNGESEQQGTANV